MKNFIRSFVTLGFILLSLLVGGCVSEVPLITTVGTDVTLKCTYDRSYGRLPVCWGRGPIPSRGCANQLIRHDGNTVTSILSNRYALTGDHGEGDVSLTIRRAQEGDSGVYGCRVDIPGWFNDHKHEISLSVLAGRPHPVRVEAREVRERTVTVGWNAPFDGGRPITGFMVDVKNKYASWETASRTKVTHPAQVTLVDLRPAKTYNLRVFAVNVVGVSEVSNVLTFTTKEAAPEGPPINMQLQAITSQSIRVTWKPPQAELRNGLIRSYSVSYREYDPVFGQYGSWQQMAVKALRETESITLTNLKPSTEYGVIVQAQTNAGTGPPSTGSPCSTLAQEATVATRTMSFSSPTAYLPAATIRRTTTVPSTSGHSASTSVAVPTSTVLDFTSSLSTEGYLPVPPDPPLIELKGVMEKTIYLSWIPGFEGGSPITGYYLEYKAANASWDYSKAVVDFSSQESEATIIEIYPSTYNIRMFAMNRMGTSKASNVLRVTIEEKAQQSSDFTPTSSTPYRNSIAGETTHDVPVPAVVVPVVLVLVAFVALVLWKIRQMKQRKGSLSMWLTSGAIRYRASNSLQEL